MIRSWLLDKIEKAEVDEIMCRKEGKRLTDLGEGYTKTAEQLRRDAAHFKRLVKELDRSK
jgi:hypothetical protein